MEGDKFTNDSMVESYIEYTDSHKLLKYDAAKTVQVFKACREKGQFQSEVRKFFYE